MLRWTLGRLRRVVSGLSSRRRGVPRDHARPLTVETLESRALFATLETLAASSSGEEGATTTLAGTFSDPDATNRHRVIVHWGDGSWNSIEVEPEARVFSAAHVYEDDGDYTITAAVYETDAVFSPVTGPSDAVAVVDGVNDGDAASGASPLAEGVANAIDGATNKYLNFKDLGSGLVVTPAAGVSTVVGLRVYTADDAPARDPASYRLEGSNDGGLTWTLVGAGDLTLPLGRNAAGLPIASATHHGEVLIPNDVAYASYRVTFPTLRDAAAANSVQVAEVQLLVADQAAATLSAAVGVTNVAARIDALSFSPDNGPDGKSTLVGSFTDPGAGDSHRLVVAWGDGVIETIALAAGSREFAVRHEYAVAGTYAVSAIALDDDFASFDATAPTDAVAIVDGVNDGDANGGPPPAAEGVARALDDSTSKHLNFKDLGSGFEVQLGAGPTSLVGLRVYTANDAPNRDPASYVLEGSTDGVSWEAVAAGALALPLGRNAAGSPLSSAAHFREILFPTTAAHARYRVTFPTLRDAAAANAMQVGEVELLTAAALPTAATTSLTLTVNAAPTFTIGADQVVVEDAGAQSVTGFATFDPGAPEEASQTPTYHVTVLSGADLFAVGPAIDADGTLTYTLAADAFGEATISVYVQDDGGTAVGGDGSADPRTFTITVVGVDDPPLWSAAPGTATGRGGLTILTTAQVGARDVDGDGLTYTVTAVPTQGRLFLAGAALAAGDAFTQSDLDAGLVAYLNFASTATADSFSLAASDGGQTAAATVSLSVTNADATAGPPSDGPGWYRVVSMGELQKSEAGWSATDNLDYSPAEIWANSWEEAVRLLVTGGASVQGLNGESYDYDFPSGAFDVGTAAEIAARRSNNQLLDQLSGSATIIALEDKYGDPTNDGDYDDFYIAFYIEKIPEVEVAVVKNGAESGKSDAIAGQTGSKEVQFAVRLTGGQKASQSIPARITLEGTSAIIRASKTASEAENRITDAESAQGWQYIPADDAAGNDPGKQEKTFTVVIPKDATEVVIRFTVIDDDRPEAHERIVVGVADDAGERYRINEAKKEAEGYILDDEVLVILVSGRDQGAKNNPAEVQRDNEVGVYRIQQQLHNFGFKENEIWLHPSDTPSVELAAVAVADRLYALLNELKANETRVAGVGPRKLPVSMVGYSWGAGLLSNLAQTLAGQRNYPGAMAAQPSPGDDLIEMKLTVYIDGVEHGWEGLGSAEPQAPAADQPGHEVNGSTGSHPHYSFYQNGEPAFFWVNGGNVAGAVNVNMDDVNDPDWPTMNADDPKLVIVKPTDSTSQFLGAGLFDHATIDDYAPLLNFVMQRLKVANSR